jgi:glucosyl-3-phosphoglycerate synthase
MRPARRREGSIPEIDPGVRRWFVTNTSTADDWPVRDLLAAKGDTTVSVVLPARNEAGTVGVIVEMVRVAPSSTREGWSRTAEAQRWP